MLPYENRLRRPAEFRSVIASGQRVRRGCLVVHQISHRDHVGQAPGSVSIDTPIVGFVVGKAVGSSVIRHLVSRRLRAQMTARLPALPTSSATVVRALAGAGDLDSSALGRDLDAALARLR